MAPRLKPPKLPEAFPARVKTLFSGPLGTLVLDDLNRLYNDRSSFDSDALKMAHNEGQRSLVRLFNNYVSQPLEDLDLDGTDPDPLA